MRGYTSSIRARRILVISHDASRTGAPMVALLIARCLADRGERVSLVSQRPGPLMADFAAAAPTSTEVLHRVRRRLLLVRRAARLMSTLDTLGALATLLRHPCDIVYVNSTSAAVYLRPARWLRRRVILHAHESHDVAAGFLERAHVRDLSGVELVACSPSVQQGLATLAGRDPAGVRMVASVPDSARVRAMAAQGEPGARSGVVVGAVGSVGRRKGTDLWLQAAREVLEDRRPGVSFVWVGEIADPEMAVPTPGVEFLGPQDNPFGHLARFDIATLPSRDDPFPLVVLEAMLLGRPVVAFDVGSVSEQVGDGGVMVAAGDVSAFAAAITRLVDDEVLRRDLSLRARRRAEEQFSTEAFARGLLDVLDEPDPSTSSVVAQ